MNDFVSHDREIASTCGSVVPDRTPPTEAEFHAAMLMGLSRCSNSPAKKRALAGEMDLSSKGLDNILLKGAMPNAKRLWDALRACSSALDDVAALHGFELVRRVAVGAADSAGTVPLATLLAAVAAAESPASDSGCAKSHRELLAMEDDIRSVHALTATWMKQITDLRSPRVVTG